MKSLFAAFSSAAAGSLMFMSWVARGARGLIRAAVCEDEHFRIKPRQGRINVLRIPPKEHGYGATVSYA